MRQIREILEYRLGRKVSAEQTSQALSISKGTVINVVHRFESSGLPWPLPAEMDDTAVEQKLYPSTAPVVSVEGKVLPDIAYLERELRRPNVTLQRLYEEHETAHPGDMSRAAFYRHWLRNRPQSVSLKILHKGGDKLFVDFSGNGIEYIDRETGEVKTAQLFVCSWGASSFTYAHATQSQSAEDFVMAHVAALTYFGVAPHALVPDNLKAGVTTADRYDPVINQLYGRFAQHYGIAVLPARPVRPQDKAVVESNVLHVQRTILARLRDRQFFSVGEINQVLHVENDAFNRRPMKDYNVQTRQQRFEDIDRPLAQPLPAQHFCITRIKTDVRVAPNYHIRFEDHFYSVPYKMARELVDVFQSGNVIEIYHKHVHVCRHLKGAKNFGYTTVTEHMPHNHRAVRGWSKEWFMSQAQEIGPSTVNVVERLMKRVEHVQQSFNAALGLLRLARAYTPQRLECACGIALNYKSVTTGVIKNILEQHLDKKVPFPTPPPAPVDHKNIRGTQYYTN